MTVIVRLRHVRALKLCSSGMRAWFKKYDLDYNHFLDHGYPAETIEAVGDAIGLRVVAVAREEARRNG